MAGQVCGLPAKQEASPLGEQLVCLLSLISSPECLSTQ